MPPLYITSDRPGAGKTALAASLATLSGKHVSYYKPYSPTPDADPDVDFVGESLSATISAIPLPHPKGRSVSIPADDARKIKRVCKRLSEGMDLALVEGPSLADNRGNRSLIAQELPNLLKLTCVLIIKYRPRLNAKRIVKLCEPFDKSLLGIVINGVTKYKLRNVAEELGHDIENAGIKLLGIIPEDQFMLSVDIGHIVQHLNGEWILGQNNSGKLVRTVLIGGNTLDSGVSYFERADNKVVIIRGDRPDIQLAALSTPTSFMILTGGQKPIEYVYYLAERDNVPIATVETGTVQTADLLGRIMDNPSVHHIGKIDHYRGIISQEIDIETIRDSIKG